MYKKTCKYNNCIIICVVLKSTHIYVTVSHIQEHQTGKTIKFI